MIFAAGGADAVRQGGLPAGAIDHRRLGNMVVGTAHTLAGAGFFILLNSHLLLLDDS